MMPNTALGTIPLPFAVEVENSDAVGRGRFHVHNIATICAARRTGTVTELSLLPAVAAPEPLLFLPGSNHLSRPENPAATVLPKVSRRGRTSAIRGQLLARRALQLGERQAERLK